MLYILSGIIGLLVIVALFTFIRSKKSGDSNEEETTAPPADCCGAHAICEKGLKKADTKIAKHLLYDDGQEAMLEIIADCLSHMPERCNQIITMFYYEEKGLDDIIKELQTFESKNALKTAKYKCMENLRKAVREIYYRHVNT